MKKKLLKKRKISVLIISLFLVFSYLMNNTIYAEDKSNTSKVTDLTNLTDLTTINNDVNEMSISLEDDKTEDQDSETIDNEPIDDENEEVEIPQIEEPKIEINLTDVKKENWYYPYFVEAYSKNIISGFPDNTFRANATLTRDQFIKMLVMVVCPGFVVDGKYTYWFQPFLDYAQKSQIEDQKFEEKHYKEQITREEATYYAYKALNVGKDKIYINEDKAILDQATETVITDKAQILEKYKEAINVMYNLEIINGYSDGTFKPKGNLTRAESTVIISNILKQRLTDVTEGKTAYERIYNYIGFNVLN